ncbi:hypothetical protein AU196_05795 [Mycobacterium sp. IS-1742]|uniref:endonuclease domain-containing protein n=1 Tax=Mycobacterium sp. IS-1742 TaxID=1772285 RepID=UPI00073FCAC5|nr:hypothetical protein [Mycobacterium sp. IS-1742]KUI30119.1 hypothetical protein AU196_05795 [Mycobacterium sp. IS-1742]
MSTELRDLFDAQGGVASSAQILNVLSRRAMQRRLDAGVLSKVWPGIYCFGEPDDATRLAGLDLRAGESVAICLATAAAAYGFDTEGVADLHVLNPVGHLLRNSEGLIVHRRDGAPLTAVDGRPATTPDWTAVEVARGLRRPRALATLDAALRSGTCSGRGLRSAAARQAGRRGIVAVRQLIPFADSRAESPMESEARLVMADRGLPTPVLQHEIVDRDGRIWRVDFAWPERLVAVEYDGFNWHSRPEDFRRDRRKRAALQEIGWQVISIVADDVRRDGWGMVRRIETALDRRPAA